ncbi:MAG TPA: hypothetical protein VN668_02075 [Stellaceae bacterium]|nr:hypothetical protein [Stellaceae bacterium]
MRAAELGHDFLTNTFVVAGDDATSPAGTIARALFLPRSAGMIRRNSTPPAVFGMIPASDGDC